MTGQVLFVFGVLPFALLLTLLSFFAKLLAIT